MQKFGIKDAFEQAKPNFTQTEYKIYEYLIGHFDSIASLSIHELAERTETSPSAISRFSRKIGMKNFQSLKLAIHSEKGTHKIYDPEQLLAIKEPEEMRQQLMMAAAHAMADTLEVISDEDLAKICDVIRSKRFIITSGVGLSYLAANDIYQKWSRVGKTVFVVSNNDLTMEMMKNMKDDTLFWGISNSGNSSHVMQLLEMAKQQKIPTIGLTQYATSQLSEEADYVLYTGKLSSKPSALTNTVYAQFMAIDLLYFAYIADEEDTDRIITGEKFLDF